MKVVSFLLQENKYMVLKMSTYRKKAWHISLEWIRIAFNHKIKCLKPVRPLYVINAQMPPPPLHLALRSTPGCNKR